MNSDEITDMLNKFLLVDFNVGAWVVSSFHLFILHMTSSQPNLKLCPGTTMTTLMEAKVIKIITSM